MIAKKQIKAPRPRWIPISLVLAVFFSLVSQQLYAQLGPEAGAFFFKQYLPDAYGAGPQNWAIAQDSRGVMFFGNTEGLLEYDGASWRKISLNNHSNVRSLAIDRDGTIYVGGQGEIGFLKPDPTGSLYYVSLLDQVPAADRHFADVWTVSCTTKGIVFGSYQRIFRWSPGHVMTVWKPSSRFGRVFLVDDTPYVVVIGSGLNRISGHAPEAAPANGSGSVTGESLEPVPGGEAFKDYIYGLFRLGGSLMVATPDALYKQNGKEFARFETEADELLRDSRIYTCKVLKDGDLAVGTGRGGLVLLHPDGRLARVINKQSGLSSSSVNAVYVDRNDSIWLALARGIAHIETELPLTRFGDREGLEEIVPAIERQGKTLYAGTMTGLNRLDPAEGSTPHFTPVAGIQGQIWALMSSPRGLLVGGQYGLSEVDFKGPHKILDVDEGLIFYLSRSIRDPNMIFAAGRRGLFLLRWEAGQWKLIREVPSEGQEFRTAAEDADGRVWVTTRTNVSRIDISSTPATIERFTAMQGVQAGWNYVYRVRNSVLFATTKGLLRFDNAQRHFVPDTLFGKMFSDGSHAVSIVRENDAGDIWISGAGYNGILRRNSSGEYAWVENPLARSGIKEFWALHTDSDGVAWASGGEGGLVRYQMGNHPSPDTSFLALLSDFQLLHDGQTLFAGDGPVPKETRIPHAQNALRFQVSAPRFEDESQTKYQVLLEGLDRGWSDWSSETRKEYTNLWEGRYVFHARARDLHGQVSREASFPFRVLAPWYRTWFAYTVYVILLFGCVWLIIRWRLHTLAESNRKLEAIVEERTEEIRHQRDEIKQEEERTEALLLNILPAAIAEELRSTGSVQPKSYDGITVCFTDFVGFTLSSEKVTASDLVAALDKYFTAFDEIVERYGLEKLKTIGDSYMFVGGLPDGRPSHAVDVVLAALEMLDVVNGLSAFHPSWKIRVGVHSGPVVAGVVGVKKFAFDIWGETVNFASRFESSGAPNRINVSAQTSELICEFIECEPRGPVKIKEGRKLDMYFARQVRAELATGVEENIPQPFSDLYFKRFGRVPPAFPIMKARMADAHSVGSF